ncbi:dinuclear metal center protein, YbgI/SA1388 family [Sulfurivirga caldicuralii]|uniref:Dinuclear metal center protein, YbgI/SA1388 family n=1 Tax=Sulfurivirga caldicuralii TaxID=364032 RepID=A0A1N6G2Q4_9GAMM|nr:Nif3-like dinuclear metal center hexameric protein [Sulfurivirga caldicuralii]SIO01783.1 dinuclear metal center protein, YbgI/SA1388 family [Sulfurivirga caldicuralii]
MKRDELLAYLNGLLKPDAFNDYAPNGLQVEGTETVTRIVTGVTACQALLDMAVRWQADMVLVHHGYFWKSEPVTLTGMKGWRIRTLMQHDINLVAYHLPLDAHVELGNNAQLGKLWELHDITPDDDSLVRLGRLPAAVPLEEFVLTVERTLGRAPLHLPGGPERVQIVAWCSGAAQGYIDRAADWGADVYVSGEVSEQTTHQARELGIHYLAAGHHATERVGVQALGEHLQAVFPELKVRFVDIPNPV